MKLIHYLLGACLIAGSAMAQPGPGPRPGGPGPGPRPGPGPGPGPGPRPGAPPPVFLRPRPLLFPPAVIVETPVTETVVIREEPATVVVKEQQVVVKTPPPKQDWRMIDEETIFLVNADKFPHLTTPDRDVQGHEAITKSSQWRAITGKVWFANETGALVLLSTGQEIVHLKNHPSGKALNDGDPVNEWALPVGLYKYVDSENSKRTVLQYDVGRPIQPAFRSAPPALK